MKKNVNLGKCQTDRIILISFYLLLSFNLNSLIYQFILSLWMVGEGVVPFVIQL